MPALTWFCSYETFKFDTVDGDLHKGQYARDGEAIYIRNGAENKSTIQQFDADNKLTEQERADFLSTMTEVQIIPDEKMYYDIFILPNGRQFRIPSSAQLYTALGRGGAKALTKSLTNKQIADAIKEDLKWQ